MVAFKIVDMLVVFVFHIHGQPSLAVDGQVVVKKHVLQISMKTHPALFVHPHHLSLGGQAAVLHGNRLDAVIVLWLVLDAIEQTLVHFHVQVRGFCIVTYNNYQQGHNRIQAVRNCHLSYGVMSSFPASLEYFYVSN